MAWNNSNYNASSSQFGNGFSQDDGSKGGSPGMNPSMIQNDNYLLPVTFKLIEGGEKDGSVVKINGRAVNLVTVVGLVVDKDQKESFTEYTIDDGTGMQSVKAWKQDGEDMFPSIEEHKYVKIMGKVSLFSDRVTVNAYTMRHIESTNEITHHLVSVAWTHMQQKTEAKNPMGVKNLSMGMSTGAGGMSASGGVSENDMHASWSAVQKEVYRKIAEMQGPGDSDDCFIPNLAKNMTHLSQSQLQEAICFLTNDGAIYDTQSEEYVRTTS